MATFSSLFGGGRFADVGAMQSGCNLLWDVEIDPAIADVGSQVSGKTYVCSVTEMDWSKCEKPDILWASPPCPNFSAAKKDRSETDFDRAMAQSVVDAVTILHPKAFILENVEGYRKSDSFKGIVDTLYGLGYWVEWSVLNSADFGVPQTRKRLILRAVKGGFVPSLPEPTRWVGWYEAIEDLISDLPETKLAQWQIDRLPEWLTLPSGWLMMNRCQSEREDYFKAEHKPGYAVCVSSGSVRAVLVESKNANQQYGDGLKNEPLPTIPADSATNGKAKAFIIPGGNASSFSIRLDSEPTRALTAGNISKAFLIDRLANNHGESVTSRALIENGRVVQMTSRALARFQTIPDWYELPEKNALACKIVGNGVPCELAKQIISSLIPVL